MCIRDTHMRATPVGGACLAREGGYRLGSFLPLSFRFLPFPLSLSFFTSSSLHQTSGNEINSAFLRNWRASGEGRRHFPWTSGKLLIPRHLLFNQGRVSGARGRDEKKVKRSRLRHGVDGGSEGGWKGDCRLTFRL